MSLVRATGAGLLLAAGLLFARSDKPWEVPEEAKRKGNPVAMTRHSLKQGAMFYRGHCLVCHGEEGRGKGPWVEQLPEKPRDLTAGRLRTMTDGELFWKIS